MCGARLALPAELKILASEVMIECTDIVRNTFVDRELVGAGACCENESAF